MNNDWIPVDTSTEDGRQAWNSATHGRMAYTNPLRWLRWIVRLSDALLKRRIL
jgi:hypothetical protein